MKLYDHKPKIESAKPVYTFGPFNLWLIQIVNRRFDGKNHPFKWLIFDRGDAVAGIIYRKIDGKICLVEQFRPATLIRGGKFSNGGGGVLEIIAGVVGIGEDPLACLHREVAEEAGRMIKNVRKVTTTYMSPGASSEKVTIYLAEDAGPAASQGGGLSEEGEDIKVHWIGLSTAEKMVKSGEICDAKTILAIHALLLK